MSDTAAEPPNLKLEESLESDFITEESIDERMTDRPVDKPEEEVKETPEDPDAEEYVEPTTSQSVWLDHPSIPNQHEVMEDTIRFVDTTVAMLNLAEEKDIKSLNKIMRESRDPKGPTVIIEENLKHFHEGKFYALVTYSKIQYKKLT